MTAIAEGRKCARIVNADLGGSPMDADRERLAVGAWSGEADRTLRHEAEAAGTVRPGEEFFTGPDARPVTRILSTGPVEADTLSPGGAALQLCLAEMFWGIEVYSRLGTGKLAPVGQGTAPPLPWLSGGPDGSGPPGPLRAANPGAGPPHQQRPTARCATVCGWHRRGRPVLAARWQPLDRLHGQRHHPAVVGGHVLLAAGEPQLALAADRSGPLRRLPAAALARCSTRSGPPIRTSGCAGATSGAATWSATRSTTCSRSAAATSPSCS